MDTEKRVIERVDFGKATFGNQSLINIHFRDCNFTQAIFRNCDLRLVDFSGSNLTAAQILHCDIRGTHFGDAILDGIDLTGSVHGTAFYDDKEKQRRMDERVAEVLLAAKAKYDSEVK